jgi:hypothetical protein
VQNIKLSNEEMYEILQSAGSYLPLGNGQAFLFGYPIHSVEDGFLLYIACEYCGQKLCRCGAPLDRQGKRLTPLALDTAMPSQAGESGILSRIIAELASV